ncbi:MAG: protein kinase, partial [Myxococcales bacterium]|nr:protein kinase [Myxococcales bacterium]
MASAARDRLWDALPAFTRSPEHVGLVDELVEVSPGDELVSWCASAGVAGRGDVRLAPLLTSLATKARCPERLPAVARARVVEGPMLDALGCAPLLGDGAELARPANAQAQARLEILIWEAGASALEVPALAPWIWGSSTTFEALVGGPARGTLRGRVLAARCLEISAGAMPGATDPELVGRTLRVLQPLLLHPEPLVWVHAARALGRLTGPLEQLEGMLLDWVLGDSRLLRQRAMTAFASLHARRLQFLSGQLLSLLEARDEGAQVLAAAAAATPYLFFERRDIWDELAARVLFGDGGSIAARALARGLAVLWRREDRPPDIEAPLRELRAIARRARPGSLDESRRWLDVMAATDAVDAAERDPLDLERGLENLMRLAAQHDDEEADARAARFAAALGPTFREARRIALGGGSLRQRAAALNALEGCARAFALRLWAPLLATRPEGTPMEEPDLEDTWKTIAQLPSEILDLILERRRAGAEPGDKDPAAELSLEVLAVRLGGYALDACGEDAALGPGRGPTAHETCRWLQKLEGLAGGSRELPAPLREALSALLWRLVDTARGTALGEVDDTRWLGPFAAWWALVIDRPAALLQLAAALPMIAEGALSRCCARAERLRAAVSPGVADGAWGPAAVEALQALHAEGTELAAALSGLAGALASFAAAGGGKPDLDGRCLELVIAGDRLHAALADPVFGLHPERPEGSVATTAGPARENAARVATLVARAIRARELPSLDVWFASLGPVTSALLESAVRAAIRRTPPPPPRTQEKAEVRRVEGYELLRPLGEGGVGTVWLVRKPGADRLFVLKVPKADVLASASDTERKAILVSFVEEARALAGLYHPNVASIVDRGVADAVPFLVLEYLIGADLKQYAAARLMTLFELRQVVLETCAGLAALHRAGLVHRDVKPANLWLRLPLSGGESFDPKKHRDPARV